MRKETINLEHVMKKGSKILSGREEGKRARAKFKLMELDKQDKVVEISFPQGLISINTSFFLGFLGPSVRFLGKSGFKDKYKFLGEDYILDTVEDGIMRALNTESVLEDEG